MLRRVGVPADLLQLRRSAYLPSKTNTAKEGELANEIFISYRRSDEPGYAGRLFDRLEQAFRAEGVFMDVDGIPPGHAFDQVIRERLHDAKVVLAIIGTRWLEPDETGKPRLDQPNDLVRHELQVGLEQENRVIPVLVENARPLREDQLPESLKRLARCQAIQMTHRQFHRDADSIIDAIKSRLAEVAARGKRTWDRSSFLVAARGAPLKARLEAVLEWASARYSLRWGKGATYGTALISPKGHDATVLSVDTSGMAFVYMENLQRMRVFGSLSERQEFVARLNTVQGLAISRERAERQFIGFQIGHVDREDMPQLLSKLDTEFGKIA